MHLSKTTVDSVTRVIDRIQNITGAAAAVITVLLLLIICYDVVTRYIFNSSSVALQELEWHLYSLIFLLGAGYTYLTNEHVRIDVFHSRLSPKKQMITELVGILLFLIPFCITGIVSSEFFVTSSWRVLERSPDGGGLPGRYILKAMIPLSFFLLLLAGVSTFIKTWIRLSSGEGNDAS
ncbi:MAG: TRAP transporter small permease subunit [Ignavibacteriaceae bacterium]|nr:TRAP transporter small permease subunit [Ignavibacteriaceae bacterium]